MKLSALDAPPPVALPLVPVAEAPVPDCRQPVTVIDWFERLLEPACDPALLAPDCPLCAPTPTLSAAAKTVPKRTLRFMCVVPPVGCLQFHRPHHVAPRRVPVECVLRLPLVQPDGGAKWCVFAPNAGGSAHIRVVTRHSRRTADCKNSKVPSRAWRRIGW